jgi:hypothetical protein
MITPDENSDGGIDGAWHPMLGFGWHNEHVMQFAIHTLRVRCRNGTHCGGIDREFNGVASWLQDNGGTMQGYMGYNELILVPEGKAMALVERPEFAKAFGIESAEQLKRWLTDAAAAMSTAEACHLPEIAPGLFLGSAKAAEDADWLHKARIDQIMNVTSNVADAFTDPTTATKEVGWTVRYKRVDMQDTADEELDLHLGEAFEVLNAWLESKHASPNNTKNLLVHCLAGRSRSASIVIAWAMYRRTHSSLMAVWQYVEAQRVAGGGCNKLAINCGFETALWKLDPRGGSNKRMRTCRQRLDKQHGAGAGAGATEEGVEAEGSPHVR